MNTKLRVLVVEDSEDDTLLLVRLLQRGGYDVAFERVDTARRDGKQNTLGEDIGLAYVQPWSAVTKDVSGASLNRGRVRRLPLPSHNTEQWEVSMSHTAEVTILLLEDDPGHARLIERNQ